MKKKKRRLKKKVKVLFVFSILLIVIGIGVSTFGYFKNLEKPNKGLPKKKVVEEKPKEYKASLIMVGDALIHDSVYNAAKVADGTYDFKPMLELTKPITSKFDLAYYNQETILGGKELGYSNYPRFNSPQEVGAAFIDSGFNLVSLASNHTMDKGERGVINSISYWSRQKGVNTAGSYTSFEERDKERIYEINGIKYAFLAYTTWTNGLETPKGKEYLNNVYSNELAKADIERVRSKVDVVLVAIHWGTEYSLGVSPAQEEIANYLSTLGVDIIIGAHPHVVEPVEYIGKTLVIYSLGNYISHQITTDQLTGLMFAVDIKKTVDKNITNIAIENPRADLLYTKVINGRSFKVYPYSQLNNNILANYMSHYEKYKKIVTSRYQNITIGPLGG